MTHLKQKQDGSDALLPQKMLVAFASRTGSTAGVAEAVGEILTQNGASVDVLPMQEVKAIAPYGAIVAGAAPFKTGSGCRRQCSSYKDTGLN